MKTRKSLLAASLGLMAWMAPLVASAQTADHATGLDLTTRQARLVMNDGTVKYYSADRLDGIDFDRDKGTVTVRKDGAADVYTRTVAHVTFAKPMAAAPTAVVTNRGVEITEACGWNESAYVLWTPVAGADGYHVYVKGEDDDTYVQTDQQLVRRYDTYCRADVVGLAAGRYTLKVVPVAGGKEMADKASTASGLDVRAYDRSGFAHLGYSGVGAYTDDGRLKPEARVVYVTARTAKTVSLPVVVGKNNKEQTFTGLQAIINAYQKGLEKRPLCVRLLGQIKDSDMDAFGSKAEGLQVKGKNDTIAMNITIEGIGNDATVWGFGFLLRNAVSVELRNFGIMLCMDDAVSIDTHNKHCWIHHLDFFYGKTGGDSDQAKGDGTVDIKGNSQYITVAYNHFFDSGKSSLCGMKSESGPNYIDYHHNWFDHSDSRHPRVRSMSVHVWNNYYDGCAKYGVGATMGASVFVERNFFRHSKNPMLISRQGTDAIGQGTFSGENGGMVKSFGNVYAETGGKSGYLPVTHKMSAGSFDCYEASSREETVPQTFRAKAGDTPYDNFDTDASLMYAYSPVEAVDVPAVVTGPYGAGRMEKGDFKWTFDNTVEDTDYGVITALKTALQNYLGPDFR